jgi:hypothetical protein
VATDRVLNSTTSAEGAFGPPLWISHSSLPTVVIMPRSDTITLGLVPTLNVSSVLNFGPLTLTPVGQSGDDALAEVARRFADKRDADPTRQALVTCSESLRPLVVTIWPLFVFACITFFRRRRHLSHDVPAFPEQFYLINAKSTPEGLLYDSGHSRGIARPIDLPLRWPVDKPETLHEGDWDERIERACSELANDAAGAAANATVVATGMAADLACAAMERRSQRVENVASNARACVLLGSAYEALHCKGAVARHFLAQVIRGVGRLRPGSTALGERVFSGAGIERPPRPEAGVVATRPMFAVAQLVHLRNTYAHGRAPAMSEFTLPAELNECSIMRAATLTLAVLIGDELQDVVDATSQPIASAYEAENLLEALAEAIIPANAGRSSRP